MLRKAIKADPEGVIDIILDLKRRVEEAERRFEDSERRIRELEARLKANSRNSSKPPSSDGYAKPSPKNQRRRSGRKSGGQKGHPGSSLQRVDSPDKVVEIALERCPYTGEPLGPQDVVSSIARQVFELPEPRLEAVEYRALVYRVPGTGALVRGAFPDGVSAPAQYGFRFMAWLVYLADYQLVPLKRVARMCEDLYGHPVSQATVEEARRRCSARLEEFERVVGERLGQSPVLHCDETGMRVGAKTVWLHTVSSERDTLYHIDPRRGGEAVERMGVLPGYEGWLVHDFWKPYLALACRHAICNAHIVRELAFFEELGEDWARRLKALLLQAGSNPQARTPRGWRLAYRRQLRRGRAAHPYRPPPRGGGRRGRRARPKAVNLLDRLELYEDWIWAFAENEEVPFTNNLAERDVRMAKVKQKVSGCFRSWEGARAFARVRSYISTCSKRQVRLIDALANAMRGQANTFA